VATSSGTGSNGGEGGGGGDGDQGGGGGDAHGGAIYSTGLATVETTSFKSDTAAGGAGQPGGQGGAGGDGSDAGDDGAGSANATGGDGGNGGDGGSGGNGGHGGAAGSSTGGAIYGKALLSVSGLSFSAGTVSIGSPGSPGASGAGGQGGQKGSSGGGTPDGKDGLAGDTGKAGDAGNPGTKGSAKLPNTDAPTFGAKTLSVSPDKRKAAASGAAYSASLSATGGIPPYTWAVLGLPPGLSARGTALSGTPTSKGAFTVIVVVSDSAHPAKRFGSRAYTLKVT
jgi:hypothetical protein